MASPATNQTYYRPQKRKKTTMLPKKQETPGTLEPLDRNAWRDWLSKNHSKAQRVWLVIQKKGSSRKGINLDEALDEAVCFGWVDSKLNVIDTERFKLMFSPRKPGSIWAQSNKKRVERLMRDGLMAPSGLQVVERAKLDGSWKVLDDVENLKLPGDLKEALSADKAAWKNYEAFPDSAKKQLLWWVTSAKRTETRTSRIRQVIAMVKENRRTNAS